MDGIGTQLFLHTPTIELPYDLSFGLVDHEVLWSRWGLTDIRVAIGRIPPVHASLTGGKEPPTACPLLDQRPFILRKDPLHLEQHLFFRARPEGLMHEDDLAPVSDELLHQHHLIGIPACEAVRRRDQNDLKRSFFRQIP